MCGICGQFRFDNNPIKHDLLTKMLAKLASRGPDYSNITINKNIALGHSRLAIIDLSTNANQPIIDKELKLSIVFNGTIYNYQELRKELVAYGYKFFSHSDTETIIKAYHRWGEDCVLRLDGAFAFAIYDKEKLFLARDRMGIKPLYYSIDDSSFSFASNTQALLINVKNKNINKLALEAQLSLHGVVPAPDTIISGINKLTPAHTMVVNKKGVYKIRQYWYPDAKRIANITEDEYIEHTHFLLQQAVLKRILAADVAVGVLLSGGLDSSLLVAILSKLKQDNIRTFSIGFEDVATEAGSEFLYSDTIVNKFNTKHHKYTIKNTEVLQRLPETVANMAEPMVAQDAVAFYLLSEQVSKKVKVVLSGQGADEAFAGYFWYPKMQQHTGNDLERFSKYYIDRPEAEYYRTIVKKYQTHNNYTKNWLKKQLAKKNTDEFLDKVLRMDITRLIVDDPVKRVDNMTMAWGLEARVPFMDTKLVEWALAIPPSLKLKEQGKYPLKKIARNLLPHSIIDRKKGYFPMPALKYVKGGFLDFMVDILTSSKCINRGIFAQNYIQQLLKNPEKYMTALNGSRLWHLALLELWLQINKI